MTAPTATNEGIDNFRWMQGVADHPELDTDHVYACYVLLGWVESDMTDRELYWLLYDVETCGFLQIETLPRTLWARLTRKKLSVKYTLLMPDHIPTKAEIDADWAFWDRATAADWDDTSSEGDL